MIAGNYALSKTRVGQIKDGQVLRLVKYLPIPGKDAEFKALLQKMSEEYQYSDLSGCSLYSGCFTPDGGVVTAMMFDSEEGLTGYKTGLRDKYLED